MPPADHAEGAGAVCGDCAVVGTVSSRHSDSVRRGRVGFIE